MTPTSPIIQTQLSDGKQAAVWINIAAGWHTLLAIACAVGIFWLGRPAVEIASWLKIVGSALLGLVTLTSGAAALQLVRRRHAGRMLSLVVNYLGFLFSLLYGMHVLGIYAGIDSLGDTFGRGIPYLGVMAAGYLIGALGDRYEAQPELQRRIKSLGAWVALAGFAAFLLAVGILPGLLSLLGRFTSPLSFALAGATAAFGLMIWIVWRRQTADALGANNVHAEILSGYLFLSPNLLGFLLFFAGPLLFSLSVSFTNWDAFGTRDWVGLDNYKKIFNLTAGTLDDMGQRASEAIDVNVYDELTRFRFLGQNVILGAEDKLFWLALRNTFMFSLLAVPLSVIPALLLANLLNSKLPGMKFFRAVYFLPSIAAVVGVALIWQWLYNAAVGFINYGITSSVEMINAVFGAAIVDPGIRWLSDTRTALLAVVIMSAWQWVGFNTVLFLAGLQNIPTELYEAATVDGAGRWAKFWNVTIPMLAPTTFFVVTTAVISALQLFEQVYVLIPTEPPGGPNNSTLSLVLYLYQKGFQRFEQGYASAVAWVLFIVIFGVTLLQYTRQRRGGGAYG